MELNKIIKEVGRGKNHARDIDFDSALALYGAMLDGEVPDLEMGSILIALRIKGEGEAEMRGFYQAMQSRVMRLQAPSGRPMPVVIPSYNGARRQGNLTPLLAQVLNRLGLPVLVHGVSDDATRVTSEAVFAALGILPVTTAEQAQAKLDRGELAFITIDHLCPPMAKQLSLRWRMGVRNSAHTLAKLATPFGEREALRLSSVSHPEYVPRVATFFSAIDAPAILLNGTEGEVYANPQRCPAISYVGGAAQQAEVWVERQPEVAVPLPADKSAAETARWTEEVLNHQRPLPEALRLQIACCLRASGQCASREAGLEKLAAAGF
ncbi:anthranilate phosphoribosyltransferase [Pantoea sp. PA1]|jgi:anthranilate phosphoribosyltransferase|uniref:DNA-binding protein YbiB n=1 Tax=Pantoea TaxID=53335 RepID=UPI0002322FE6|nr:MULTISPECIES: DNA-binding protein YbiB [Pantoea]AER33395.1 anthranilate phosphoribosyltransferase YbiB [Pantoea ananatis PA13]AMB75199.1 glycosyl transferase [Pantoea ananatis]AVG76337.1 DNA-binding protein YbiB [Pantoea ananatis]MDI3363837.1 DNA-binding protein YbiB [Pantoea sp. V108_6]MDN4125658.1 DNA-binding protein YbiB [Pantoea ananatis]